MNILDYIYGFCEFSASGYFPERFINLASHSDLGMWDIRYIENGISAKITARRFKKLLPLARKCKLRLRVIRKHGLPFRLYPYRHRAGIPLGFFLFCGIIWVLSQFYWIVDIPQVSPELQGKLEAAIYEAGVRPGVLRSQVDADIISNELQLELNEISWAGITSTGSYISVDVRELEKVERVVTSTAPCNIIAARDGIIYSVAAENGQPEVDVGQAVLKGDLLISGVMEYPSGDIAMVHAQGEVIAATFYEFVSEIPYNQHRKERTGRVYTIRRLMLLGLEIPLYIGGNPEGNYEREYHEWQLEAGGTKFPLVARTERWYELRYINRIITTQEAEALAYADIEEQLRSLGGAEIISRTEEMVHTETGVILKVVITAKEDIADAELILFE